MVDKRFLTLALTSTLVIGQQVQTADAAAVKAEGEEAPAIVAAAVPTVTAEFRKAFVKCQHRTVATYLTNGGDPDAFFDPVELPGVRLIHIAAMHGNQRIMQLLCDANVTLDAPTPDEAVTALIASTGTKRTRIAQTLIQAHTARAVGMDARSNKGTTAFLMAAMTGNAEIGNALYAAGANIKAVDNDGDGALHLAAYANQADFAEWYLSLPEADRLDNASENNNGLNALDIAALKNNSEILSVLEGADLAHSVAFPYRQHLATIMQAIGNELNMAILGGLFGRQAERAGGGAATHHCRRHDAPAAPKRPRGPE